MVKQRYSHYDSHEAQANAAFKYCPFCQAELIRQNSGGILRPTCPACGFIHFRNPSPSVCVVILDQDRILLGKRAGPPGKGKWAIPSGYIEFEDDYISTAIQEAKEETGLDVEIQAVFNVLSSFYSPRYHFLAIYTLARVAGGELQAGDDMAEVDWFPLQGSMPELAFVEDVDAIKTLAEGNFKVLPISEDQPAPESQG
jgi:ADP-ribose pyrophosphatase YjhB (NUDIX family)